MAVSKQWAMIRSWLRKIHNKEVVEFFKDLPPREDPDNSSGRSTSKAVCLIGPADSQNIAQIKIHIFENLKAKVGLLPQQNYPFASLPQPEVQGEPQIQLWFYEKYSTAKTNNRQQVRARISFRVKQELSMIEFRAYALRIKQEFATPIYSFDKGRTMYVYYDKKKQYSFKILSDSKQEVKQVLTKVFNVIGDTPNWTRIRTKTFDENFDNIEIVQVLGDSVQIGPYYPRTKVYFRHAIAKIPPLTRDFALVDTTGEYWNAIYHEPNPYLAKTPKPSYVRSPNLRLT